MLNYVSVGVTDIDQATSFYDVILGIMGYVRLYEDPGQVVGYGETWPEFWITQRSDLSQDSEVRKETYISISAPSFEAVDAFYKTGLEVGAEASDSPGYRPTYGHEFYSASIYDLDGNHIEASYYELSSF
ncbi:VOC family protein [Acaryochloris marina]|uniref:Glyoxalase/bleomycin resistance protein/dioxygenase n=1 Tax=Acaryochloris marina (strain MBIC 11017) TaxID=329726 RepID=A8ZPR2_ACAM1|nr:VOC family protein [Acaryochloris marina]ABW33065.1 Glyoxalase/bleomycin resistance protein/dioxygenase [Acaryochloris marina MBIC11017]